MSLRNYVTFALLCATGAADTHFGTVISAQEAPTFGSLKAGLGSPNATGRYPISGPNATQPYPGTMIGGWELEIDVAANVPITVGPARGRYASAAGLKLNPPAELVETFGSDQKKIKADVDSWYGCLNVFGIKGISGDAGNGTCESLLSSDCIANLRKAILDAPETTDGSRCPNIWNVTDIQASGCPLSEDEYAEPFDFREDFLAGYHVTYISETVDDAGDLSTYNALGTATYPVIITWGHTNDTKVGGAVPDNHVAVVCAQANVTTTGSQVAEGKGLDVGVFTLMLSVVGAVFMLLL